MMPLFVDAVPHELRAQVVSQLRTSVASWGPKDGPHPSSGGVGARWILQTLVAINSTELALSLATQTTSPSWGHMALTPPGTLWEGWAGGLTGGFSHNHIMLGGGIDPWMYHNIGGLRVPSTGVNALGFGRGLGRIPARHLDFGVEGVVARRVRACNASVRVTGGRASVSWAFQHQAMVYNISVPLGYTAELRFPAKIASDSSAGWLRGGAVNVVGGQLETTRDDRAIVVSLRSGWIHLWMHFD